MGLLSWIKGNKRSAPKSKQSIQLAQLWNEDVEDFTHDIVHTERAILHMRKVLAYYSRYNYDTDYDMDYETTRQYMRHIGLLHPRADDVKYLRHLKVVSQRPKYMVDYSSGDFQ